MEAAEARGQPLPDWYLDEPFVYPAEQFYFQAFNDLSTCRQIGMDLGPIPWDTAMEYAQDHGLDAIMRNIFWGILVAMDKVFSDWRNRKTEQQNKIRRNEFKRSN